MAPRMQKGAHEPLEDDMIGVLVAVAGTLLLISSGKRRRPAPQPSRSPDRRR